MAALAAHQVVKQYRRGARALDLHDLEVGEGELCGLLGPNGAGKSTLVRCALDLIRPDGGEITLLGHNSTDPQARVRVGYVPETPRFPSYLSAIELMRFQARLAGVDPASDQIGNLLEESGLHPDAKVGSLSKGMLKQLAISQALIGDPLLLLMDEPTADLDPLGRRRVREMLVDLHSRGVAVLLSSHLLSEVERVCTRVAILHKGGLIASGPVDELVPEGSDLETVFIDLVTRAGG